MIANNNGDPISFAIVHNHKNDSWIFGNENGHVFIDGEFGDTITVSRYGYEPLQTVLNESDLIITLYKDLIQMEKVQVTTRKKLILDQARSFKTNGHYSGNISSIFNAVPSLQIRTYGGQAGNATTSIDGGPGSHTKVVYEGIDITSPQNGETDISQIPPDLIGTVSSAVQPGVHYGSGTADGIIYLKNHGQKNGVSLGVGSWERMNWSLKTSFDVLKANSSITIGQRSAKDNYAVTWREQSFKRENNDFLQSFASGKIQKIFMKKIHVKSVLLLSDHDRGIAGQAQSPSLDARRNDQLFLGLLKGTLLMEKGYISLDLLTRQSQETYDDPNLSINSRHELITNSINFASKFNVSNTLTLFLNGCYMFEEITSTDTEHHIRQNVSSFLTINYDPSSSIKLIPSVRYDQIGEDHSAITVNGDLLWNQSGSMQHLVSVGNSFSSPTFNDMYWVPGGNPDLEPETTTKAMYLITWENKDSFLDLKIRHVDSQNLIVWIPDDNYWSPKNISSSSRSSISLSGEMYISQINFSGHLNRLWTRDQFYNKPLRYAPEWSGAFKIQRSLGHVNMGLSGRYTGKRIAMYDYPEDITLSSHFIPSFFVSRSYEIKKHTVELQFSTDNLFDKNFETIAGYPEPKRSVYLNININ